MSLVAARRSTRIRSTPDRFDPSNGSWVPGGRNQFSTHQVVDPYDRAYNGSEPETNHILEESDDGYHRDVSEYSTDSEPDYDEDYDDSKDSDYEPETYVKKDNTVDDSDELDEEEFNFSYETDEDDDDSTYTEGSE